MILIERMGRRRGKGGDGVNKEGGGKRDSEGEGRNGIKGERSGGHNKRGSEEYWGSRELEEEREEEVKEKRIKGYE